MKDCLPEPKFIPTRRSFLGQLTAFFATLSKPAFLLGAMRSQLSASSSAKTAKGRKWSLQSSPLLTRWSSLVDPQAPYPEYPRPQFVRKEWLNLNGLWEYEPGAAAGDQPPFGKTLSSTILVPYAVESALSGIMEHHDRLWYRRSLTIPAAWRGKRILLHFGAVDYESEVFVDGKSVGLHRGGYDPFSYDITPFLTGEGDHELLVRVFDPTEMGGQPRGKQTTKPRGIMYTPTTGIWQTVWLEPVNPSFIQDLTMVPDIDRALLNLSFDTANPQDDDIVDITVKAGSQVVSRQSGAPSREIAVSIRNQRLWSPEDPFLYTLELELRSRKRVVDSVTSYFGMRKLHVGEVNGEKKLQLNNRFVFQLGPLDQGFWPDGIYTPPTDDAMKNDIFQMKALGFNMVRKHIKVEPARWYYWTDTLGLLVWQDMPSCNSYPGHGVATPPIDKEAFRSELQRMVETHRNVPSIVLWTIFNEGQGQFDTGELVSLVNRLDPSRLVNEASGGDIMGFGNLNDIHSYPEPAVRPSNGTQAMVCGEFGGIGYLIPDHSWSREGQGYVGVDTPPDLLYLYAEFLDSVHKLRDQNNLSAAVYTQLTDVMTEVNGLLTYDRVAKVPAEQLQLVNTFRFPAPTYKDVVPTSQNEGHNWKFALTKPGDAWTSMSYDEAQWSTGPGGFGNDEGQVGTRWTTPDLWLRRHFRLDSLTSSEIENLVITEFQEGSVEIFINGTQTFTQRGTNRSFEGRYEHRPISEVVRKAVVLNADNVIAVHCAGNGEKRFFDAGLSVRIP
jgi:hypothetical protein